MYRVHGTMSVIIKVEKQLNRHQIFYNKKLNSYLKNQ